MKSDLFTPGIGAEASSQRQDSYPPEWLFQARLNKTFQLTHELRTVPGPRGLRRVTAGAPLAEEIQPFSGMRQAYIEKTGDEALAKVGARRVTAMFNVPTFENAMADSLHQLLLADYGAADIYRWQSVVNSTTAPSDYRALQRVRLGYIADVPEIEEDGMYDEAVVHGDESISYAVTTRGLILTITRRAFINDDIMAVRRAVEQIGRACWRTLAKRCWAKLIDNAVYLADDVSLFDASHGNLGTDALSATALSTARAALFNQVELGSAERLGLGSKLLLVVPLALEDTAFGINQIQYTDASFTPNPWFHRFGENNENIFVNPLLTDDTDWYLIDISGNCGLLEIGFLQGTQEPVVVLGDNPAAGQMFSQDRQVYKFRHEYEVAISDFRGMYKSVVAA